MIERRPPTWHCASVRGSLSVAVRAHDKFSSSIVAMRGATARSRWSGRCPTAAAWWSRSSTMDARRRLLSHPRLCGPSDGGPTSGLRGDRLLPKTQAHMPCRPITWTICEKGLSTRASATSSTKRRPNGQRPTSPARLRELQRAHEQSEQRLRFAEAQEEAAVNEGDSSH